MHQQILTLHIHNSTNRHIRAARHVSLASTFSRQLNCHSFVCSIPYIIIYIITVIIQHILFPWESFTCIAPVVYKRGSGPLETVTLERPTIACEA